MGHFHCSPAATIMNCEINKQPVCLKEQRGVGEVPNNSCKPQDGLVAITAHHLCLRSAKDQTLCG